MLKIALFGTSADPPTAGHQAIISWLSQHYDWVAVWAADNPFKSHASPLEHRATMLRLLIEDINPPRHNIGLHQELSSHRTLETVNKAKQRWDKDATFTLVIGSDLVHQLQQWYAVEELLQQVQLLVVPRPGYEVAESDLQQLRQLGAKFAIANLTAPDVSSTAYRESGDSEALTPPVEAYIHQQHLYECQHAAKEKLPTR
ncbi:nicotinate-nucleotide adenylyltransferase [Chroogloeocystis siderophila]|uniref:Probable nicotinate-nucleotide adenylyltransferase n=1 Tax=Chroogloeocystis siderophila 5.2 s.c.1 TaxID=247279 RepID=A0A1U7HX55_9CHRO|nr:nicotinate-nucleotide adenylyltransferase [Chroogloeocystis siderophila]OKH28184.1 nicotinic acid mononucleotide adenylyltransferase [Chroogloeocystis siderophila 5.2 s.c.1]